MDKSRKREILNEYKKTELEKLSRSDDKIIAAFAKNRLGLKSDRLSVERLNNVPDDALISTITDKIDEVLQTRYKSDPRKYRSPDNAIRELNESLRAIHFTNIFEMSVGIGDTEKFLEGATQFEFAELVNGYRVLGLEGIADKISLRKIDGIEKELSDRYEVDRTKIEFVRGHMIEFELK